jgi:hypothetical protein
MLKLPWMSRLAGLLLALASATLNAAEAPVVAKLEYSNALLAPTAKIRLARGAVTSPFANQPHSVWTLREGEALEQPNRPPERLIQLYQVRKQEIQVVASLFVKYVAGKKGWRPAYALHITPPAYWDGQRLVPLEGTAGAPLPIQIVASGDAAGEGFVHTLSFSSPAGAVSVDAWEVQ